MILQIRQIQWGLLAVSDWLLARTEFLVSSVSSSAVRKMAVAMAASVVNVANVVNVAVVATWFLSHLQRLVRC